METIISKGRLVSFTKNDRIISGNVYVCKYIFNNSFLTGNRKYPMDITMQEL